MFVWVILSFIIIGFTSLDSLGQKVFFPDIIRKTYPSGFEMIAQPDTHLTGVNAAILVQVGRGSEPVSQAGICQLIQALIVQGNDSIGALKPDQEKLLLASLQQHYTSLSQNAASAKDLNTQSVISKTVSKLQSIQVPQELDYLLTAIGISNFRIEVFEDYFAIQAKVPTHQLPKWLKLMAEMLRQPLFRDPEGGKIEIERAIQNKEMNPKALFIESATGLLLNNHPYGNLMNSRDFPLVHHPNLDGLYSFYQSHFTINKIKVLLTGNFNSTSILPILNDFESQLLPAYKDLKQKEEPLLMPLNKRKAIKLKSNHSNRFLLHFRIESSKKIEPIYLNLLSYVLSNDSYTGVLDSLLLAQSVYNLEIQPTLARLGSWLNIYYELPPKSKVKPKHIERIILSKINTFFANESNLSSLSLYQLNFQRQLSIRLASGDHRLQFMINHFSASVNDESVDTIPFSDLYRVNVDLFKKFIKDNFSFDSYSVVKSVKGALRQKSIPIYSTSTFPSGDIQLSEYGKNFLRQPTTKATIRRYRQKREFQVFPTGLNQKIYYSNNPYGDAYTLVVKLYGGGATHSLLPFMARYLNIVGTYKQSVFEFKEGMFSLGTTYDFSVRGEYLVVEMTGWDSTFSKSIKFLHSLITNPESDIPALDAAIAEHNYHQIEVQSEPQLAIALRQYMTYKKYSPAFKMMNEAKLLQLEPYMFRDTLRRLLTKPISFHYHGMLGIEKVYVAITDGFNLPKRSITPRKENVSRIAQHREPTLYHCPQVARFAYLSCYLPGEVIGKDTLRLMQWLNTYIAHPKIGVMTQELSRISPNFLQSQFTYQPRERLGVRGLFIGQMICAETEVIPTFTTLNKLVKKLPKHTLRDSLSRLFLFHHSFIDSPDLSYTTIAIEQWEQLGFKQNPSTIWSKWNRDESIDSRFDFYQNHIRNKTIAYAYLGESKLNDIPKLSRFGKIVILEKKEFTRY